MSDLRPLDQAILEFLKDGAERPPSEIHEATEKMPGGSYPNLMLHLRTLKMGGFVERGRQVWRITDEGRKALGITPAGVPVDAPVSPPAESAPEGLKPGAAEASDEAGEHGTTQA